jgi:hypothetical protein
MYKSIIDIIHTDMEIKMEGEIMKAVQRCGIHVDKEELLKTLQYDIGQYDKGYEDGLNADKWIPCEVELPKTNGVYQVIREIKEGEVTYHIPTASYFDGQNTWHNDICVNFGRQNEQNVIAWQPIQPYKKEGAE